MPTDVKLPRLGQGMESGVIVRWLKAEGDSVSSGDPLYELDTDKVTQEVEAEADGVLLKIVVAEGEVEVGSTVAVIGEEGESAERAPDDEPEAKEPEEAEARPDDEESADEDAAPQGSEAPDTSGSEAPADEDASRPEEETPRRREQETPSSGTRLKASPLARRMARERGIDLAALTGTGPDGRILAEDVERAGSAPATKAPTATPATRAPTGDVEVVELTSIRKTIARRLTEAWTAPVFQLGVTADMTLTQELRSILVERLDDGDVKPTVNDILVRLVASALTKHPAINATFTGEQIQRHPAANVGIAVAAPQGLIVPVIPDAARLTVQEIARARADLVGRARDNKLTMADLQGGTFTISNLGMFGVEQFTAVLNPPQVAILAVGAVEDQAVVRDGQIEIVPRMHLTLTCDHRAIDGADGAVFLQTLVALVERPGLAL